MAKNHAGSNKREKFTQPKKSKAPIIALAVAVVVLLAIGGIVLSGKGKSEVDAKATAALGQSVSYSKTAQLQQTEVTSKVENGKVVVTNLKDLQDKKFVWTLYQANGKRVPLTALVRPNGKVVVAVSVCEPCNSEKFHITGNQIICNACGTTWDLDTFKGISGGCQKYPPEILTYTQNGDNLEVQQSILDTWKPRV